MKVRVLRTAVPTFIVVLALVTAAENLDPVFTWILGVMACVSVWVAQLDEYGRGQRETLDHMVPAFRKLRESVDMLEKRNDAIRRERDAYAKAARGRHRL